MVVKAYQNYTYLVEGGTLISKSAETLGFWAVRSMGFDPETW